MFSTDSEIVVALIFLAATVLVGALAGAFYRWIRHRRRLDLFLEIAGACTTIRDAEGVRIAVHKNRMVAVLRGDMCRFVAFGEHGRDVHFQEGTPYNLMNCPTLPCSAAQQLWSTFLACCCTDAQLRLGRPYAALNVCVSINTGQAETNNRLRHTVDWNELRLLGRWSVQVGEQSGLPLLGTAVDEGPDP